MTTAAVRNPSFEIARVIENTLGAFRRNFVTFYGMALLLSGAPVLILLTIQYLNGWPAGFTAWTHPGAIVLGFVSGLVSIVTTFLLQGALVWGAVADLNGRRAPWDELLRAGLRVFWPLFLIAICFAIAVVFGLILLVVPAVMMAVAWAVVAPVEVVERRGVFASFSRSAELTRGHRWAILALFMALLVASWVVNAVVMAVGAPMGYRALTNAVMTGGAFGPGFFVFSVISTLLTLLIKILGAVGAGALYYELRAAKEGIGPEVLASIFD